MPLKNQPFSKDQRDPYWASRIDTPEAGELLAAYLKSIDDKLRKEETFVWEKDILTSDALYGGGMSPYVPSTIVQFNLPDGLWELVHFNFEGAGGTDAYRIWICSSISRIIAAPSIGNVSRYNNWKSELTDNVVTTATHVHYYSKGIPAVVTREIVPAGTHWETIGPIGGIFRGGINGQALGREKIIISGWTATGDNPGVEICLVRMIFNRLPNPA